jgi:hypothetical protein
MMRLYERRVCEGHCELPMARYKKLLTRKGAQFLVERCAIKPHLRGDN